MDEGKADRLERLVQLYLAIIGRYKAYIEEKESFSVAELPTLVTPKAEQVVKKASDIEAGFGMYSYEAHFGAASKAAFDFVRKSIEDVTLPLQFWLAPSEVLTYSMGDSMDKNILLCSLLISLGNPSAKVFVRIDGTQFSSFTYCEFKGRVYRFNIDGSIKEYENRDALIQSLSITDEVTAYEFNNQSYQDVY